VSNEDVVITGIGIATPLGHDPESVWGRLVAATSAIRLLEPLGRGGSVVDDFVPREHVSAPRVLRTTNRPTILALAAAHRAWADAGFGGSTTAATPYEPMRFGIHVGSGESEMRPETFFPGLDAAVDEHGRFDLDAFVESGLEAIDPYLALLSLSNNALCYVSIDHQLMGPNNTYVKSSVSSTQALGEAALAIRHGYADAMMVVGVDALSDALAIAAYDSVGLLCTDRASVTTAMRPFDRRRSGFMPGEGAGALVLERAETAARRGARVLGRVLGFGQATDTCHLLEPPPDGGALVAAIEEALADAGLAADRIDFVLAAGEATVPGDASEAAAIARASGGGLRRVPVTATKPLSGHLGAASGAVESIHALLMMQHRRLLPIANLEEPAADLRFVAGRGQEAELARGLHIARGIGGQNAAVVLGGALT
jgi:3-oxoacyl-[acyl-carrier-protein] synthase II